MANKKYFDALSYHAEGRPGKIEVVSTKPTRTQFVLAFAYSHGVDRLSVVEGNSVG